MAIELHKQCKSRSILFSNLNVYKLSKYPTSVKVEVNTKLRHQKPIMCFSRWNLVRGCPNVARFGANVVSHEGQTFILGGIVKDQILKSTEEICTLTSSGCLSPYLSKLSYHQSNSPRPLLIGSTVVSTKESIVILGGSAVCFSFGTFWNEACFTVMLHCSITGQQESGSISKTTKVRDISKGNMRSLSTFQQFSHPI